MRGCFGDEPECDYDECDERDTCPFFLDGIRTREIENEQIAHITEEEKNFSRRRGCYIHVNSKRRGCWMPDYTGLKDFARGVQRLYQMHGNIPVFLSVNDDIGPFGIALLQSDVIEGQDAMVFKAYSKGGNGKYKKGTVTE